MDTNIPQKQYQDFKENLLCPIFKCENMKDHAKFHHFLKIIKHVVNS